MLEKQYNSAVDLPFKVKIESEEANAERFIMKTAQFYSAIGSVKEFLLSDKIKKNEKEFLTKKIIAIELLLRKIDQKSEMIDQDFIEQHYEEIKEIIQTLKESSLQSDESKIILNQLFKTSNTIKSFFDNGFKANFM